MFYVVKFYQGDNLSVLLISSNANSLRMYVVHVNIKETILDTQ